MAKASASTAIKIKKMSPGNITDKEQALKTALAGIEKQFGAMAVMRMGDRKGMNIESISTGLFTLDLALGVGGLPKGRITEVYGPESSGKTTIALLCVAETQKSGGTCVYIDVEHALDPEYAKKLGVNTDELYVSQPNNGEQALGIAEEFARSGAVDVIVVDSVAALVPKAEIDGEMGQAQVGLQARLMSQGLRKLTGVVSQSKTVLIFINQLREKIGTSIGGPQEVTTGGKALKFYASVRLDIRRKDPIKGGKDGAEKIGYRTSIKVVKNKVASPFKAVQMDVLFGSGFDKVGAVIELGVKRDLVKKSGSWYTYHDHRAQGMPNVRQLFTEHEALLEELKKQIMEQPDEAVLAPNAFAVDEESMTISDEEIQEENRDDFDLDDIIAPDDE